MHKILISILDIFLSFLYMYLYFYMALFIFAKIRDALLELQTITNIAMVCYAVSTLAYFS